MEIKVRSTSKHTLKGSEKMEKISDMTMCGSLLAMYLAQDHIREWLGTRECNVATLYNIFFND